MENVYVNIRIDQNNDLNDIVNRLQQYGLNNVLIFERFHMVSGQIEESKINNLWNIEGIISINQDRTFKTQ